MMKEGDFRFSRNLDSSRQSDGHYMVGQAGTHISSRDVGDSFVLDGVRVARSNEIEGSYGCSVVMACSKYQKNAKEDLKPQNLVQVRYDDAVDPGFYLDSDIDLWDNCKISGSELARRKLKDLSQVWLMPDGMYCVKPGEEPEYTIDQKRLLDAIVDKHHEEAVLVEQMVDKQNREVLQVEKVEQLVVKKL